MRSPDQPTFPDLAPDEEDLHDDMLQSFHDIRRKTLRDLYGSSSSGGGDKSPKGSVDDAIRPLVNLLNFHPSFATLSSCSGRIAFFDPHGRAETDGDSEEVSRLDDTDTPDHDERRRTPTSGKGRGRWLLSSHVQVEPETIPALMDGSSSDESMILKHEPLLLHVAASCLARGQQLLTLALQLGFRESGLVVSSQRVTVAVRGQSLALAIPLARRGYLRPPDAYLASLIRECNRRMQMNHEKLHSLQIEVQNTLFRKLCNITTSLSTYHKELQPIPPLNLWKHAAVAVPNDRQPGDVDCFVFGGYGSGPDCPPFHGTFGKNADCRRSEQVVCLSRRGGVFDTHWSVVPQSPPPTNRVARKQWTTWYGVHVCQASLAKREGAAACILPLSVVCGPGQSVVAIFGGRASPERPSGDLLLFEPATRPNCLMEPVKIQGQSPQPRWGHSLTPLSGKEGLLAVLVGGRDGASSFGTIHVLSIVKGTAKGARMFRWDKLDFAVPARFDHATVAISNCIIVLGGLSDPNDLLESFSPSRATPFVCALDILSNRDVRERDIKLTDDNTNDLVSWASGAACAIPISDMTGNTQAIIAFCGGVPTSPFVADMETFRWLSVDLSEHCVQVGSLRVANKSMTIASEDKAVSSLLNHHAIVLPPASANSGEMIVLGGGTSSFVFGPAFSRNYLIRLSQHTDKPQRTKTETRNSRSNRLPPIASSRKIAEVYAREFDTTDVLFVGKQDAKALKTALEAESLLDRTYRMTKALDSDLIAVPITKACVDIIAGAGEHNHSRPTWESFVLGAGVQPVPFSSSVLGRRKHRDVHQH